ncbi:oxidoreductase C-terminal domain-containing protein [Streptomyces sp. NPDC058595]|uniref:oxidoreductase C-terminal domain-containing protein n=1 Tax=Streptomyces sp. NPDC058595 TaxID=3346550 RepID=UPI00364E947D
MDSFRRADSVHGPRLSLLAGTGGKGCHRRDLALCEGPALVVRGYLTGRAFIAFWLADGRVLAGMNVNVWDANDNIQHLVRSGSTVERAALADLDVPLDQFTTA